MEKRIVNIERALARQDFINKWTNILIMNEYRRLRHEKVLSADMIETVETKLRLMTNDNYHDTMNFLTTVLDSVNTIYFSKGGK